MSWSPESAPPDPWPCASQGQQQASPVDEAAPPVAPPAASPGADEPVLLSVDHETIYHYGFPVELAHHVAFLQPLHDTHQAVERFELAIEPSPSHQTAGYDRYGNLRRFFSTAGAHRELHVAAHSRVRLRRRHDGLDPEASPPWEQLRDRLRYRAGAPYEPATEFSMPSPYVPRLDGLRDYALPSFVPGRPLADAVIDLMHRIHADYTYASASTQIDTPLATVLAQRRGVCQDFAHVMIGALRMLGLPARYVSGYLLTTPPPGVAPLVGADASHAWVAAWCPGAPAGGWIELDPTNDVLADTDHVRLAVGRDFGDVTPLRGVIRGGGAHDLTVRVTTRRLEDTD